MDKTCKAVVVGSLLTILIAGMFLMQPGQGPMGSAAPRGSISTIDVGSFSAELSKTALSLSERAWTNGSYSSSFIQKGNVTFWARDLWLTSNLTITTITGTWPWNPANKTGNRLWFSSSLGSVEYQVWDTYLKEKIVLNSPVSAISWKVNFATGNTITMSNDDWFVQDIRGLSWRIKIQKPSVTDAVGTKRNLKFTYNTGTKILTLVQDFAGLIYPLTIDPTYTVDSTGNVGDNPMIHINQSGYPYIVYVDSTNARLKVAVNESGPLTQTQNWKITTIPNLLAAAGALNFDFDSNGLPIIIYHSGLSGNPVNITYYSNNAWRVVELNHGGRTSGNTPFISRNTTTNIVKVIYGNSTATYPINYTEASWASLPPLFVDTPINPMESVNFTRYYGAVNNSGIITIAGIQYQTKNLKMFRISDGPIFSSVTVIDPVFYQGFPPSVSIDPTTSFASIVYENNQANYTYFNPTTNKWYIEQAIKNGTELNSWPSLAFNSSGTPHVAHQDGTSPPYFLILAKRTGVNTWVTTTIDVGSQNTGDQNQIAIDSSGGIHIAYRDYTNRNLKYYFEPLPSAGGAAPVAAFSCTPLITPRNGTVTCTDSSTNTPTSLNWYSAAMFTGGPTCFSGNLSNQNPNIFPTQWGYCGLCEIAANAYGTDTECKGNYIYVRQP